MASRRKSPEFEDAAANMRRLFGSRGGSGRQDALCTEGAVGPRGSGEDLDALAAYKKAETRGGREKEGRCLRTWWG